MSTAREGLTETMAFAHLDEGLRKAHANMGAAEAHGVMCGVLCVPSLMEREWLGEILTDVDAEDALAAECESMLLAVYARSRSQLSSGELEFYPLLPDGDQSLEVRSSALGAWCSGFLFGVSWAGVTDVSDLPADSREVISDLSKFAGIGPQSDDCESEETAFAELVEYVRVGVILISEELCSSAGYDAAHATLH